MPVEPYTAEALRAAGVPTHVDVAREEPWAVRPEDILILVRRRGAFVPALVAALVVHIGGLWITSPPDMIDALTFASPTPFSPFGVVAMWAIFAVALLAAFRRRWGLRPQTWRLAHMSLAVVIVVGVVAHAVLIEGTMETVSKATLCVLVLAATVKVMVDLRVWRRRAAPRADSPARQ